MEQGATVEEGQLLCIIEAMKMENEITAHKAGTIDELPIKEGDADRRRRHDRGHPQRARARGLAPAQLEHDGRLDLALRDVPVGAQQRRRAARASCA